MKIGEFVFNKESGNYGIYVKDYATDTYKIFERFLDKNTYLYKYDYVDYKSIKKLVAKKMTRNEFSIYESIYSAFVKNLQLRKRTLLNKISAIDYSLEQLKEFFTIYTDELMEEFYLNLCKEYEEVNKIDNCKSYFCMIKFTKNKYPHRIDAKTVEYRKTTRYSFFIITSLGKKTITILDNNCKVSEIPVGMYESMEDANNVYNALPLEEFSTKECNVFTLNNLESYVSDYLYKGHPLNLMRNFPINLVQVYNNVNSFDDLAKHLMSLYGDDTLDAIHTFELPDDDKLSKFNSNKFSGSIYLVDFFDGSKWNVKHLDKKGIKVKIE